MKMTWQELEFYGIDPDEVSEHPEVFAGSPGLTAAEFEECFELLMAESWGWDHYIYLWPSDFARLRMLVSRATFPELKRMHEAAGLTGWIE